MDGHLEIVCFVLVCHFSKLLQAELPLRLLEPIRSFGFVTFLEITDDRHQHPVSSQARETSQ